jgi:hypothetical protein
MIWVEDRHHSVRGAGTNHRLTGPTNLAVVAERPGARSILVLCQCSDGITGTGLRID